MIRILRVHFSRRTLLLALSESFIIVFTLLIAIFSWFGRDGDIIILYDHGVYKILLALLVCMLSMHYYDLYESIVLSSPREGMVRLVQVLGTVCVLLTFIYYAYPALQLARGAFLIWICLAGILLAAWRYVFYVLNRSGRLQHRTLLLGAGALTEALPREIALRPELGIHILGCVDQAVHSNGNGLRRLGTLEQLSSIVRREQVSRVIVLEREPGKVAVQELVNASDVLVQDGVAVYETITGKVHLPSLRSSWSLAADGFRVSKSLLLYKRVASILFACVGLVLLCPLMALIAVAIRLDSRGPIIFRQRRIGKDGQPFTIFKFRSMAHNSDADGMAKPAQRRDVRITRVGRLIRIAHLDELPQLWNILRGEMYFVGPRPFACNMEEELSASIPFYNQRWAVKPGATGWAQIQRGYCNSLDDNADKLSFDLFYIKNLSVGLDLLILFQTLKILVLGRGAR